jgi:hypothetical protein
MVGVERLGLIAKLAAITRSSLCTLPHLERAPGQAATADEVFRRAIAEARGRPRWTNVF